MKIRFFDTHSIQTIHNAARLDQLEWFVEHNATEIKILEQCDDRDQTPLHYAVVHGALRVATYLLEHQLNIAAHTVEGETPLMSLCRNPQQLTAEQQLKMVKLLLNYDGLRTTEKIVNTDLLVNAIDGGMKTALHVVKEATVASLLIRHGAFLDACDMNNCTPLDLEARHTKINDEKICVLLEYGANPNGSSSLFHSPLRYLLANPEGGKSALMLLSREKIFLGQIPLNPFVVDEVGHSLLTIALNHQENVAVIDALLQQGCNLVTAPIPERWQIKIKELAVKNQVILRRVSTSDAIKQAMDVAGCWLQPDTVKPFEALKPLTPSQQSPSQCAIM